ncbi:hypothetical protein OG809_22370 [Kribbella soli]
MRTGSPAALAEARAFEARSATAGSWLKFSTMYVAKSSARKAVLG